MRTIAVFSVGENEERRDIRPLERWGEDVSEYLFQC